MDEPAPIFRYNGTLVKDGLCESQSSPNEEIIFFFLDSS